MPEAAPSQGWYASRLLASEVPGPETTPRRLIGKRQVLIVEDECVIAQDIAEELRSLDASVAGPAVSVQGALEMLDQGQQVDAAVLDIRARDDFTYPVADRLRRERIPFVFVTGLGRECLPDRYRDVKVWPKPFDVTSLARSLIDLD